ncbi:ATP-binding protein [Streptosporangium sp. NPDC048047]|uniref:ATP-binding protein n=1 Tax=Streptosporangium sp. NPDC048047 TaxID=3155748 RepID=UPI00344A9807
MSTDYAGAPLKGAMAKIMAALPERVLREWEAEGCLTVRYEDDPADVRTEVRARRRDIWKAAVPAVFVDASLDQLTPEQDPDGQVSGWLASGATKLLLVGDAGTGKSYAGFAVANAAVAQTEPLWVMYYRVPDLIRSLQPSSGREDSTYRFATECDLLYLDDFGAEMVTDWRLEQLWRVIDHRTANRLRMLITTNLPYDDKGFKGTSEIARPVAPNLVDTYGLRIVDRMIDGAMIVRYVGRSRRTVAPW